MEFSSTTKNGALFKTYEVFFFFWNVLFNTFRLWISAKESEEKADCHKRKIMWIALTGTYCRVKRHLSQGLEISQVTLGEFQCLPISESVT